MQSTPGVQGPDLILFLYLSTDGKVDVTCCGYEQPFMSLWTKITQQQSRHQHRDSLTISDCTMNWVLLYFYIIWTRRCSNCKQKRETLWNNVWPVILFPYCRQCVQWRCLDLARNKKKQLPVGIIGGRRIQGCTEEHHRQLSYHLLLVRKTWKIEKLKWWKIQSLVIFRSSNICLFVCLFLSL